MRTIRFALTLMACLALAAPAARAQDGAAFLSAHAAMEDGAWDLALRLAEPQGQAARDLVTWSRLRAGAGAFPDYRAFLDSHPHWPGLDDLRAEAERSIPPDADPQAVIDFFGEEPPVTGQGAVRLATALEATGQGTRAEAMLIDTWLTLGLDDAGFGAMLAAYGPLLDPYHPARVEAMLWRWRASDAERLLDRLPAADRALAEARIALIRNAPDADAKAAAVPEPMRGHPGLAVDIFNRLAREGDYSDAIAVLAARTGSAESLGQPDRWAAWRARLARWLMRQGEGQAAYDLASAHQLEDGTFYVDLEWLAGYLALTYLNDPELAIVHFERAEAASDGPISLSRAGYWQGRALDAMDRGAEAAEAYGRAAQYQTAFYGLLAADTLGRPLDPALAGLGAGSDWREAPFLSSDLGQALTLMLEADDRGAAVLFVLALARQLDADGVAQLGAMLDARGEPFLTVLAGKAAAARGVIVPSAYFPLHPLAQMQLPVAPELALSVARRESEFNHVVGSPVGALGLMQLMPGTAREVAGQMGLGFSRTRLTSDWEYNARLGARYLAGLRETFGPSPVMIAAGYNAGPSRPWSWMTERGDPRRGEIDPVDWIEHIPFDETRNYVMRVTESIPVYRARLTGETGSIGFIDLITGRPPFIRPVARPVPEVVEAEDGGLVALPETPPPGRPLARPEG